MNSKPGKKWLFATLTATITTAVTLTFSFLFAQTPASNIAQIRAVDDVPMQSAGSENYSPAEYIGATIHDTKTKLTSSAQMLGVIPPSVNAPPISASFDGFDFDDNGTENGTFIIPPDPIGAAGFNHVVAVGNSLIEWRLKTGVMQFRDALSDFFAPLSPATRPFDPKIIYDQYTDRFVVVALQRFDSGANPAPGNVSRILLAVSDDGDPNGVWFFHAIDSKTIIGSFEYWADYPGFSIDEEAVYITNNMFSFAGASPSYGGVRLWIIDKGLGSGGFYDGGAASVGVFDPYATTIGIPTTTQPAHVFGSGGVGGSIGTFLVSYSGLTDGTFESVQVIRIDDPLGTPIFTHEFVSVGDIDATATVTLPDAPQSGTTALIEVNDRRALHAVWRNNSLWLTATLLPSEGLEVGQTTAHWWELNTSAVPGGPIVLKDQGNIGGEDIAPGTYTFFPSIAVDGAGNMKVGFSASAASIFAGAYVTGRLATDPVGTVQPTETVRSGLDYYIRTFGGSRNRWGDYSGMAIDPVDDATFWIFNDYALPRGTPTSGGEDGRWGTAWASCGFGQQISYEIIPLQNDDSVLIGLPFLFPFCDNFYIDLYVGSNGYLTFGAPDTDPIGTPAKLASGPPRIAALWRDLDPSLGGTVSAGVIGPDFFISFTNVPEAGGIGSNSFSIILRLDGTFQIDYGVVTSTDALVGRGTGTGSIDTGELDLSITPQPFFAPGPQLIYEWFTGGGIDNVDLGAMALDFDPCVNVKATLLLANKIINFNRFDKVEGLIYSNRDISFAATGLPSTLIGDVSAVRNIDILAGNTITGNVTAGGIATVDPGATVTGSVLAPTLVPTVPFAALGFGPFGGFDALVPKNDTLTVIPGTYDVVRCSTNSVLNLSSGVYEMNRLVMDRDSKLRIDASGGPIILKVDNRLLFRRAAAIELVAGSSTDIYILYDGIGKVLFSKESKTQGTVYAPTARVKFATAAGFLGSVCANRIDVNKHVRLRHHLIPGGIPKADEPSVATTGSEIINDYTLGQNYPNPFNPSTKIKFALPEAGHIKLQVYDIMGKLVQTLTSGDFASGRHEILWNGRNSQGQQIAAGTYIYRLTVQRNDNESAVVMTRKMTFLK